MKRASEARSVEEEVALSERDFNRLRKMLQDEAGIELSNEKRALMLNRLQKRVNALGLTGFRAYADLVLSPEGGGERQTAIDLLTTNETYFFREPRHFEFLKTWITQVDRPHKQWRIWSAASSSGEEAYSIAMTLSAALGADRWEVLGSDISRRMLDRARSAHYPIARMDEFPPEYLRRYCLKGVGPQQGTLLIDRPVRSKVSFQPINFMAALPELGSFDAIFLRNALIYFKREDKEAILRRVQTKLRPGGYLFVSHSESLFGLTTGVDLVSPSIYQRPAA
jgi:chemotaxis protein methyltransferase CheR